MARASRWVPSPALTLRDPANIGVASSIMSSARYQAPATSGDDNFSCPTGTAAAAHRCQEGRIMDLEPIMRLLALVTVFPFLVAPAFAQSSGQNQQQTQI